jgi:2-methylcitrate dehydratase PrpD
VKRNPVCSAAQAAIEEVARLSFETGLSSGDIDTIFLEVPNLVRISLVHDTPATPSEAQFSLPFAVACAVRFGAVRLEDLDHSSLQSVEMASLMERVQISVAKDLSTEDMCKRYPESARVRIVLNDASERKGFCGEAYGMPGRPLSDTDFLHKFLECLTFAARNADVQDITGENLLHLTADLFGQSAKDLTIHTLSRRGAYSQRL